MTEYYADDTVTLLHGNALTLASSLAPRSVQTIVTSPPYFGLRDYDNPEQFGAEESLAEFVQNLVDLFAALRPALADDGTLWLNLGDSYAGSWGNQGRKSERGTQRPINGGMLTPVDDGRYPAKGSKTGSIRPGEPTAKNLVGVPWRVAFALQADGWILRSDIIWAKPNPMPESVTDRPTKAHEYLFLLAKSPHYFYNAEAIAEDAVKGASGSRFDTGKTIARQGRTSTKDRAESDTRNKRTVWEVATVPFPGSHFAVYPPALIRPCILACSRPGDTVLDPFSGSGTTGMVATQEGRKYIGIDLNREYLDLSLKTRFAQPVLNLGGIA